MVINGFKPIFRRPCPELTSSERTQQLRSKTVYSGTVNLAKTIAAGNNNRIKTYNGPYEVVNEGGNSNMVASQSYDDLLSITKGKFLLNQLPLNSYTQSYYQKNFGKEEMYIGNYNQFDPSFNFTGNGNCNDSVLVYDISANGFTGSYDASGGFIGVTGPPVPNSETNKQIFIDPDHCYYSNTCLKNASYTRFVSPELAGLTGTGAYFAQQIIGADQYRGFAYPMPNFNLTCVQQIPTQSTGPLFCSPVYQRNTLITTFPPNMYKITYLNSNGNSTPVPQLNGFTVYQFGVGGTIPLDTEVTHSITYSGSGSLDIYYAVIGGGGGGGSTFYYSGTLLNPASSGGGGGGFFYSTFPSSTVQLLSNVTYSISVGGGGSAGSLSGPNGQNGSNGQNSVINFNGGSQFGYGGGGGATAYTTSGVGNGSAGNGSLGNGGGGAGTDGTSGMGGAGTFNGGPGSYTYAGAGGGGGMTQAGGAVPGKVSNGGNGIASSINGSTQYFGAGGGGGAATNNTDTIVGIGGQGGGGNGGWWNINTLPNFVVPQNGANVFGSGGGGAPLVLPLIYSPSSIQGANGGSGSVWIRFNSYTITN